MADIVITPANVLKSAQGLSASGVAGATILAGEPLYKDSADSNKLKPADSNESAATSDVVGIALHSASAGQPIAYVYEDPAFTPGAVLTVGEVYTTSATAGGIAPVADLLTGHRTAVLFVATTAALAVLKIVKGGAAHA